MQIKTFFINEQGIIEVTTILRSTTQTILETKIPTTIKLGQRAQTQTKTRIVAQ